MRRSFLRDKHWLLLATMVLISLVMAPAVRAQSQSSAQDQDHVQAQDPIQGQEGVLPQSPVQPGDGVDSHARIVRISYVDGQVRIDRGQGYESATMNIPVTERNWLQTRSDGWAEVQLEDGSLIRVAPDTVIAFTRLGRFSSGGTATTVDLDQGANAGAGRFEGFERHLLRPQMPVVTSMVWPSARVTIAFLESERMPSLPRKRLVLPHAVLVLTPVTLTLNRLSIAALIIGLAASRSLA